MFFNFFAAESRVTVLGQLCIRKNKLVVYLNKSKKCKASTVTGYGGLQGSEMSRVPHFLDNRLADGGEVVNLTRRPLYIPQEESWYSFLSGAESTSGL
jgi:hypothetical protein